MKDATDSHSTSAQVRSAPDPRTGMTSLQSNTGVDWQAAYNYDTHNHRSIDSVPVLPGQEIRSGHGHGVASSRFFSRKSLLGSSTSGVAASVAKPPQLLTIPERFIPREQRQSASSQRTSTVDTPAARLRQQPHISEWYISLSRRC